MLMNPHFCVLLKREGKTILVALFTPAPVSSQPQRKEIHIPFSLGWINLHVLDNLHDAGIHAHSMMQLYARERITAVIGRQIIIIMNDRCLSAMRAFFSTPGLKAELFRRAKESREGVPVFLCATPLDVVHDSIQGSGHVGGFVFFGTFIHVVGGSMMNSLRCSLSQMAKGELTLVFLDDFRLSPLALILSEINDDVVVKSKCMLVDWKVGMIGKKYARRRRRFPPQCAKCGTDIGPMRCCAACMALRYCGSECQRADWTARHKAECPKFKQLCRRDTDWFT